MNARRLPDPARRRALGQLGAAALAGLTGWAGAAESPTGLEAVRARGELSVALYDDMPPFHVDGHGIDVDLAQLLATGLGVRLRRLPFPAGENMGDDLRNMVWKGHYLGYGPADVLLHVPVDRPLMTANPQVLIFAPYCRDRVAIARDLERVPRLDTMADVGKQPVAASGDSLAGLLVLGADGGALRDHVATHWKDGTEAAHALQRGEVVAAAGLDSELQSVLAGDPRFEITPLPVPLALKGGWAVGMAAKKEATDLAQALQGVVDAAQGDGRLKAIFARGRVTWRAA